MFRTATPLLLSLIAAIILFSTPATAGRPFSQTGFSITSDQILDYFDHRGGARVLGYPLSREFELLGSRVQFFQRAVLQLGPDGSVAPLNIADQDLFRYSYFDGSLFPALDPTIVQDMPSPADPDYVAKAIDFVKAYAPDSWEGRQTNFYSTFMATVTAQDVFTEGGNPDLLPLINLELWGLPVSSPTLDQNNPDLVYLRFQRGIMRFDASSGITQALPVGDYLKSLITGYHLPGDLDQEARGSRLYRQYNDAMINGLNRPADMPGTNMFAAFAPDDVVVPTPVPPTATPLPATPTPAVPIRPDYVEIVGSAWFVDQTNYALRLLPDTMRDFVYRVEETSGASRVDLPNRTLYVTEATAFAPAWRELRDNQIEWYAGLIAHNATHIEQYYGGRAREGIEAEQEALLRQKAILQSIDTTPNQKFTRYLIEAINKSIPLDDWQQPVAP